MKISMTTSKNSIGHWNTQIAFTQKGAEKTIGNWLVDVDQNVDKCGDNSFETVMHLTAPVNDETKEPSGFLCTRSVPAGYELVPGFGYYKFHATSLKWPQARKACERDGAQLLVMNSQAESDVAKQILAKYPAAGSWFLTGILEHGVHAEWYTIDGTPLEKTGFTKIHPGENNALGPSDFGAMHRDGDYADVPLNQPYPFICEISA